MPPSDRSDDLAWDQFEAYRQAVVKRVSERLDEIIVTEFKTAGLEFVELGDLHRSIGRAWREIRNGNEILGLAIAFSRGKTYGRAEAISELGSLIERDESRSRNDDWVEIVVAAQGRHGRKLSPLALLEKMGGVRHATEKKWTFPGGEIVDQQKFVAWCKAANKRPSRNPI